MVKHWRNTNPKIIKYLFKKKNPTYKPVYKLLQAKQTKLKNYINKNLKKGY